MKVTQKTQAWGNSTGIRLPKKVLLASQWQEDQLVSIDVEGESIILKPIHSPVNNSPTLDDLLSGVTPNDIGGEISWGVDRGLEIVQD